MSALLRSGDADRVQAFAGPIASAVAPPHPLEAECAALRAEVAKLRANASRTELDHARALEAAIEKARAEGLASAQAREAERLATLEAGLAAAVRLFGQRLEATDRLAAELAGVAIERVVEQPDTLIPLTTRFIARQIETLRASTILRAHISAADFPEESTLQPLEMRLRAGDLRIELIRDAALPVGRVRLECALGEAELDLAGQFRTLAALLRDLASA